MKEKRKNRPLLDQLNPDLDREQHQRRRIPWSLILYILLLTLLIVTLISLAWITIPGYLNHIAH